MQFNIWLKFKRRRWWKVLKPPPYLAVAPSVQVERQVIITLLQLIINFTDAQTIGEDINFIKVGRIYQLLRDGVHGILNHGHRMVGTDEYTEL